jgi:glyoxylase-like metal-dependent hydrolase (beta-lactamase superfamily II)
MIVNISLCGTNGANVRQRKSPSRGGLRRAGCVAGLALAFLMSTVGAAAGAGESATVSMTLQRVAEGVYFVQGENAMGSALNQGFVSNAGVVIGDGGVLVVDALGTPALARRLIEEIAKITPQPIRYVVVTHYHADHIYGLQAFKAVGATIVGHVGARDYLSSDTARLRLQASRDELFPWIDETTRVVEPDRWLERDGTLSLGSTSVQVRHVGPAHTPEDLAVVLPDRGVVFAGDLVFRGRIPFVGGADSRRWIASLETLIAQRPTVVVPGHGTLTTDVARDLVLTRDYLAYLRETMGRAARELEPFEEAYAKVDWSRFENVPLFRLVNRMNAYNTYLLMEAQAGK